MRTVNFTPIVVFLLCISGIAFANRPMEREEILQIFQKLTNQPRKTWIPAGTIEATRKEYRAPKVVSANVLSRQIKERIQWYQNNKNKRERTEELQKMRLDAEPFNARYELSNEYTMSSTVVVKFDGVRFYWEINVNSRTDSIKPGKDLAGNFMTEQFDLDWNTRRIFVWDGEKYTNYFLPGNCAIVDATDRRPHTVNGPLTAGIVPWGYDYYTYENLSELESFAVERYVDGQTQIQLTLNNPDGLQMVFVLDPQKDYAVMSYLMVRQGDVVSSKYYSDYRLVTGNWVPLTIVLERYEAESNRLLARDLWNITDIDTNIPESYEFEVDYEDDALIEQFSFSGSKSEIYRRSQSANTDLLLAERLAYVTSENMQSRNCATAALKYAALQLGKNVTDKQLANLVSGPDGTTNLYQIKQLTQGLGLYCRAVKTNIQTLKRLSGCQVILHIPGKKHFVVLEAIDDKYVWTIDLASRKFYDRTDIDFFSMDWADGTALIISNNIIKGDFAEIGERDLGDITGAAGYQCNRLRQIDGQVKCDDIADECAGSCLVFWERWGCGPAESGSCSQTKFPRFERSLCIECGPYCCTNSDEWIMYYIQACD